jgi:hypothetical protein
MGNDFQGLINDLDITVNRDDLFSSYLDFANQAVRDIAQKHSFAEMKAIGPASVAIGQTRVTLPADFKELQNGRYPVFDSVLNALAPVFIRSEVEKLLGAGLVPPYSFIYTQDATGGAQNYYLDLAVPATAIHTLTVYYFALPANCDDPTVTVTNPLVSRYFNLVRLKARSLAFESINDPVYKLHEMQFLTEFQQLTGVDVKRATAALRPEKE